MNPEFVKPRYDAGGFAGIPNRITEAFASGNYDAVVLFLVDAFGWRFFERFQDAPFLQRIARNGQTEKLTSQFPSTTAAHLTTIHTGLPVGMSGVYEWYYYEPLLDAIIAPLLFSFAGSRFRNELINTGIDPQLIFPRGNFYPELKRMGVKSYILGSREYTPSVFSHAVMAGTELISFNTLSEALINANAILEEETHPVYIHLYFDKIDSLCHEYGPTAPQTEAEIETYLLMVEHYFERIFKGKKRILFLMTADHGASEVDPETTVYLNINPDFAGLERFIKTNRNGQLLVPAGSARDLFLYLREDSLDEAQAFLSRRLEGKADVVKTEHLISEGYFGPDISPRFRERVGNLVVLPYRHESVWWYEKDKFEQGFYGHHGGLTPQEMETVLYSLEI
ncbi:MAG: phosphodiesterase [Anaerolineales bacterium]|nr:alkaline phosphatase family protein [Anaerolineae bacterium]PWB71264.1 MAG: phosphodiesterase [Anaerolineales bacterium]